MRVNPLRGAARGRSRPACAGLVILLLAVGASGGCGRNKICIPSAATARQCLEAALNAWQNGQAIGKIDTVSPPVQAVDVDWIKGHKLASYEILDEEVREDGNRGFKVRLNMEQPPGTSEVRYVVVGRSPMWVYRQEDFKRASSWEGY